VIHTFCILEEDDIVARVVSSVSADVLQVRAAGDLWLACAARITTRPARKRQAVEKPTEHV
jgi:hypothetical protein